MKHVIYLCLSFVWIIMAFVIAVNLYLLPYRKIDNIDPTYSPEFDQNNWMQRQSFWGFIIVAIIIEILLIRKYHILKRPAYQINFLVYIFALLRRAKKGAKKEWQNHTNNFLPW